MVPFDCFLMSSAQACSAGLSACCAGTQLESLSCTGLSCAWAAPKARAAVAATQARRRVVDRCIVVSLPGPGKLLCITAPVPPPLVVSCGRRAQGRAVADALPVPARGL